jgi:serine/threonine-protein kinase
MLTFGKFKANFKKVTLIARGGQKQVFSATHPHYGSVVIKLFFKNNPRSWRELDVS